MAVVYCLRLCVYILRVACIYCILLIAHIDAGKQVLHFTISYERCLNRRHI